MSVLAPSICATSSILKTHASYRKVVEQRVRFQLPQNVKEVLLNFTVSKSIKPYEELILAIKDGEFMEDVALLTLLREVRECISLLDRTLYHFVEALLVVKWVYRSDEVVAEYQGFLLDLLSAHTYYTKTALHNMMTIFKSGVDDKEWADGIPTENEQIAYGRVHEVLRIILKVIPMSYNVLIPIVSKCFPFHSRPAHEQECYVYNVLKIANYQPHLRREFFFIIFKRLVEMDVNAPRSEVLEQEDEDEDMDLDEPGNMFVMETNDESKDVTQRKMKHPIANSMDMAMRQMFLYLKSECHDSEDKVDWERTRDLYHDIIAVFDQLVLATHATYHTQFLVFYLCSLKMALSEGFLSFLWRKVVNPNVASVIRQSAVVYIGSLLSRASYVNIGMLKTSIAEMSTWIHKYITCQDGLECANSDVRVHAVFYTVCQSLFYIIAFRHRDIVSSRKNLTFLQSLNLTKIVTCRLNPLKVCLPVIVQNFAAVTRTYQLVYCYSVIEHNARNTLPIVHQDFRGGFYLKEFSWLDTFFPFDPFVLKRCYSYIEPIYNMYQKTEQQSQIVCARKEDELEDVDDFLVESSHANISSLAEMFSYSSSPGFKRL